VERSDEEPNQDEDRNVDTEAKMENDDSAVSFMTSPRIGGLLKRWMPPSNLKLDVKKRE
jgi:hypothetical protein